MIELSNEKIEIQKYEKKNYKNIFFFVLGKTFYHKKK